MLLAMAVWLLSFGPMTKTMAMGVAGVAVVLLVFGGLSVLLSKRFGCCASMLALLGTAVTVAVCIALAQWPTDALTNVTAQAALGLEWEQSDDAVRAAVQDSLRCCGYNGMSDR